MDGIRMILYYALLIFNLILLVRVLLTWFPNIDQSSPAIQLVFTITEPILRPIRNLLPQSGTMDFSPLIVFLVISVLMQFVR